MTSGLTPSECRLAGPSITALNSDTGMTGRLNSTGDIACNAGCSCSLGKESERIVNKNRTRSR